MRFVELMEAGVKSTGLSQVQLARKLGIGKTTLNRAVRGEVCMSLDQLRMFAEHVGLDPDELLIASGECFPQGSLRRQVSELMAENRRLREAIGQNQAAAV